MHSGWTNIEQLDQLMAVFSLAGKLTERETLVIFLGILWRKQNQAVLGFIWTQVEGGLKNPRCVHLNAERFLIFKRLL